MSIPLKAWIALGALLAIAGLLYHDHHVSKLFKAERAANQTLTATLDAERKQRKKADASAQRYARRLDAARTPHSPPPVLLCKLPASVRAASTTTARADVAAPPDDGGVPQEVDLGPRLDVSFGACEENFIKLDELQRWVRER